MKLTTKTTTFFSILTVTIVSLVLMTATPTASAETMVSVPAGTSVPGCEETNECYIPYEVTVDVGGEVTWDNIDSAAHTVTGGSASDGPSGVFDSSLFMTGTTFSHKFEESGTFNYFCMVHPWMEGVVVVKDKYDNNRDDDREDNYIPQPTPVDDEIRELKNEISQLKSENAQLKADNRKLSNNNNILKQQLEELQIEFDKQYQIVLEQIKVIYDFILSK